jgi:hypothetical protein
MMSSLRYPRDRSKSFFLKMRPARRSAEGSFRILPADVDGFRDQGLGSLDGIAVLLDEDVETVMVFAEALRT